MEAHSFGYRLRLRRKALDLTQKSLADRVGCSVALIRKIESEERRPSAQIAERLAEILAIPQNERARFLRFARGEFRAVPAETKEEFPWQASAAPARSNLPAAVTALVGREREIAEVHDDLARDDVRLVTLIGPPGIGKTRLSIETAQTSLQDFSDGVFFIALAPLDDPSLIVLTVGQALSFVQTTRQSTMAQLSEGIRDKQMLLVLDNCEHLIEDVAALVSSLLSTCPRLKILTTSRESLRVPGEWLYVVPAFDLPAAASGADLERASEHPALILFAERARAVLPDFSLTAENIETVTAICARLDGLPLVIELMAARMRFMSPQELLDRLTGPFLLTADGMRAASERQKTLQHAIDWSYQLLPPEEQKLFACLSVFTGNFSLEAVENVISPTSLTKPVPDLVASLLDKSLLKRAADYGPNHEIRYMMLVTLREYARNRLREMGEEREIRNRHLTYYLGFAEKASPELRGPRQAEWIRHVDSVRDDLRSALDWAIETQQTEQALQLGSYLSWFWFRRSDFGEGRQWLEKAVNLPRASQYPHLYSAVLAHLARGTWLQVGAGQARPFGEKALSVARAHNDKHNTARALVMLALSLTGEKNFGAAQAALEESQTLFQEVQDEWGYGMSINISGWSASVQENWSGALAGREEALTIFKKLGDQYFTSIVLRGIGRAQMMQGDLPQGETAMKEALALAQKMDSKLEIALNLWSLGEVAQRANRWTRAVKLSWASRNIADAIGAWSQQDDMEFEGSLAACRAALDEAEFTKAVEQGRAMMLEQAIAYALEDQE